MMTIEEKAKAYDEALERAKMLDSPFYTDAAKIIFPEIEDSPDEKTRKFILGCIEELRSANANNDFYTQCCDAIDWLERHKEEEEEPTSGENLVWPNLKEWTSEDEKILHSIENIIYENVHRIGIVDKNRYVMWLEKFRPSYTPAKQENPNPDNDLKWPNLTNCKRNCKTCFAKCFYRKENNPDMMGGEKHTIGYMQKDKSFTENERWDANRIGVELWGLMESLGLPSDNLPDVYYKIAEHFFNLSKCMTMDDVVKWIDKRANIYTNGEFNEFHREFEYDGTVDKVRMIDDLQKYIKER